MNQLLQRYKQDLTLRGFSEPTYKNYLLCMKQFLTYYDQPVERLDCETIKDYLYYLLTEKNASDSKVRQVYSAMKYFYTQTLSRSWEELKIPQLRKKKKLPSYFSFNEILSLIENSANSKHKTLLTQVYSSGLRVSEAAKIKLKDFPLPVFSCSLYPTRQTGSDCPPKQKEDIQPVVLKSKRDSSVCLG